MARHLRFPPARSVQPALLLAASVAACGVTSTRSPAQTALPVWNQAYQETYEADALDDIRANARDAYVLLDPFQDAVGPVAADTVAALHANGNQVAAYISVGTAEDWRADFDALRPYLVARPWDDWAGEYFISTPDAGVLAIMQARIDRIADWGFDWVEFDNMDWVYDDGYRAAYGFAATAAEGAAYYQALCAYVHANGMRCMAKSTVEAASLFDGVTYESYEDDRNWWDAAGAAAFLGAGKPVIVVHYDAPDCAARLAEYRGIYGDGLSFLCEDRQRERYVRPE